MDKIRNKICSICKESKPYTSEFFYANKTRTSGLESRCKQCTKRKFEEYHKNHPGWRLEIIRNGRKRFSKKRKGFINNKKENGCIICHYNKCMEALEFHHVNGKEKAISLLKGRSNSALQEEIDKCIVLCANCHREIHNGIGSLCLKPSIKGVVGV